MPVRNPYFITNDGTPYMYVRNYQPESNLAIRKMAEEHHVEVFFNDLCIEVTKGEPDRVLEFFQEIIRTYKLPADVLP